MVPLVPSNFQDMKAKDPDLSSFADYAQQYHTYKNKMADLQTEVEYIKSLFEVRT